MIWRVGKNFFGRSACFTKADLYALYMMVPNTTSICYLVTAQNTLAAHQFLQVQYISVAILLHWNCLLKAMLWKIVSIVFIISGESSACWCKTKQNIRCQSNPLIHVNLTLNWKNRCIASQGRSQTFSFGGATGGASFATRGAVNGLCRTFKKRPEKFWGGTGGVRQNFGGAVTPLATP